MTDKKAIELIESNPEAALRHFQGKFIAYCKQLKDINHRMVVEDYKLFNGFKREWRKINVKKEHAFEMVQKIHAKKREEWKAAAEKRMREYKKDPVLANNKLRLKDAFLENQNDYERFLLCADGIVNITEEEYNSINVKDDFVKTIKNLYRYLK